VTRLFSGTLLITVALAMAPTDAAGQSLVCQTIKPGETASAVARRLTGRADSHLQPWFRIVNRNRKVIPKARYNGVLAGWHACVPTARLKRALPAVTKASAVQRRPVAIAPVHVAAVPQVAPPTVGAAPLSRDPVTALALLGLWSAGLGAAIGFGCQGVERFQKKREAMTREMQGFGSLFLKDFERPLIVEGTAASPIRARLRCDPGDRRLEILVAPAAGRRYPNLGDHRHNVEYDVERITQRLHHAAFVRRPLRAEGAWVVIPFEFTLSPSRRAAV
jgi:hypothetical protein